MKITLKEIIESKNQLSRLLDKKIEINKTFDLIGVFSCIEEEIKKYEEVRKKKIMQYGEEIDGKPGYYSVKPENLEVFLKEEQELLEREIDLQDIFISKEDIKDESIEPIILLQLKWLIK